MFLSYEEIAVLTSYWVSSNPKLRQAARLLECLQFPRKLVVPASGRGQIDPQSMLACFTHWVLLYSDSRNCREQLPWASYYQDLLSLPGPNWETRHEMVRPVAYSGATHIISSPLAESHHERQRRHDRSSLPEDPPSHTRQVCLYPWCTRLWARRDIPMYRPSGFAPIRNRRV